MPKLVIEIKECPTITIEQIKAVLKAEASTKWPDSLPDPERMYQSHIDVCDICVGIMEFLGGSLDPDCQELITSGQISINVVD